MGVGWSLGRDSNHQHEWVSERATSDTGMGLHCIHFLLSRISTSEQSDEPFKPAKTSGTFEGNFGELVSLIDHGK
jgi:hypothetical protein